MKTKQINKPEKKCNCNCICNPDIPRGKTVDAACEHCTPEQKPQEWWEKELDSVYFGFDADNQRIKEVVLKAIQQAREDERRQTAEEILDIVGLMEFQKDQQTYGGKIMAAIRDKYLKSQKHEE